MSLPQRACLTACPESLPPPAWYAPIAAREGRGLTVENVRGLAGIAAARAEHRGQFFTPAPVARWMWQIVEADIDATLAKAGSGDRVALIDTSAGSGRLLQFADPKKHTLAVIEPDGPLLDTFLNAAKLGGFTVDSHTGGLEEVAPSGFGLALINPPYSLTLQNPHLTPFACTCHGPYGPNTSTLSHEYAVAQALDAAAAGVAVLPLDFAQSLAFGAHASRRVRGLYTLPRDAFAQAGADVRTALVVWGKGSATHAPFRRTLAWGDTPAAEHGLGIFTEGAKRPSELRPKYIDHGVDRIGLPVTGQTHVQVAHAGRRLLLRFSCGLVKARVLNALLRRSVVALNENRPRRPHGTKFAGQGVFDLALWHTAPDGALGQLRTLCNTIADNGGVADVHPGLTGYLRNKARRYAIEATPFRRFQLTESAGLNAQPQPVTCRLGFQWDASVWASPFIRPGTILAAHVNPDEPDAVIVTRGDAAKTFLREAFEIHFESVGDTGKSWNQTDAGVAARYATEAAQLRQRMRAHGLDSTLWGYQAIDLVELMLKRRAIGGLEQAYGKTYLAFALALMRRGSRPSLIVTEPYLLKEFQQAARDLGLADDAWKIIRSTKDTDTLAGINVTTYPRIRAEARRHRAGISLGRYLRRRFSSLVIDEAESLSNPDSDQSRALRDLCATEVYGLTGTPIANYCRGLLPLLQFFGGDGTPTQPFGRRRGFFDPVLLKTCDYARRGPDLFRERHVITEWTTREFDEELQKGGKREIPKVGNPAQLRAWIAPWILRRVKTEPELAPHHAVQKPVIEAVPVSFTDAHLSYYLDVCDDFAAQYRAMKRESKEKGRAMNMAVLLRRVEAVVTAANQPWKGVENFAPHAGECRKITAALSIVREWTDAGRKVLLFTRSPSSVRKLVACIQKHGIRVLGLSGNVAPDRRGELIEQHIKNGDTQVLVITYGAGKRGINLPQASGVLFYEHSWTSRDEDQAVARVLRSAQTRNVDARVLEFEGSIDEYMGQLCKMKRDSAAVVLDGAVGEHQNDAFQSIDAMLHAFVNNLIARKGVSSRHTLKEVLRNAA